MTATKGPRLKHKGEAATVGLMIFALIIIGGNLDIAAAPLPQCSDGIDNLDGPPDINGDPTGDGLIDYPALINVADYYNDGNDWGDWDPAPSNGFFDQQCTFTISGGIYPPAPPGNPHFLACPLWNSESTPPTSVSECVTGA